jgi:alcohol dehydrogenase class IV
MQRETVRGNLHLTTPFTEKFVFNPSGTIISQWGIIKEAGKIINNYLKPQKIMLVSDSGIKKTPIYEELRASLIQEKIEFVEFCEIQPDPTSEIIEEGVGIAKDNNCTCVIGLGGGSPIDSAKGIALLLENPGSLKDYIGSDQILHRPAPLVAIPTTAGTGSEVTPWIIATNSQTKEKFAIADTFVIPPLVILDAYTTVSMPPHITAGTGMDALTHAIESYTNTCNNPVSETLALEAIGLIGANIRIAYSNGKNRVARTNMLNASLMAGMAFSNAMTGIVHALAMPCGARFHSPHGVTNAAILPHAMEFSYIANPEKYRTIATCLGEQVDGLDILDAAYNAVIGVKKIATDLELKGLKALGIQEEAIPELAKMAEFSKGLDVSPRLSTREDRINILKASL